MKLSVLTVGMGIGLAPPASAAQAISYQIGKLQILKFLTDARRVRGADFRLRDFHNYLWKNGNVPIALARAGRRDRPPRRAEAVR